MNAPDLLSRFENVHHSGRGWTARCPSHDDRHNSLSIGEDADKLLVYCHAGCTTEHVLAAVGLSFKDLYPKSNGHRTVPTPVAPRPMADPLSWLASYCGVPLEFVKTLPLVAKAGDIAFTFGTIPVAKLREAGGKAFRWEPQDASCPPLWPVPDGVPEVWLCEGESDCIVLRHLRLDAYALTKGALGRLSAEQAAALKARGVRRAFVVFDVDKAGKAGAEELAKSLTEVGIEAGILDLAEAGLVDPLAGTKDVRDAWLGLRDVTVLRERLQSASHEVHILHLPRVSVEGAESFTPLDLGSLPEPEPLTYAVGDFIPNGYPTNLYADSGQGKSYLALHLALSIITGRAFLGRHVTRGPVLYLDWELDSSMQRRRWGEVARGAGYTSPPSDLHYLRMTKSLTQVLHEICNCQHALQPVLTIVDSVGKAVGDDPLDHQAIIRFYSALDRLGTVLCIDHQPKPGGETGYASKWEFGSSYKRHLARSSWQLERVGGDGGRLGLVRRHKKTNFGQLGADVHAILTFEDGDRKTVRLEVAETAEAVAGSQFGLRSQILRALEHEKLTAEQVGESIPDFEAGSIRNELSALKRAGLVAVAGKEGRKPIYSRSEVHNPHISRGNALDAESTGDLTDAGDNRETFDL